MEIENTNNLELQDNLNIVIEKFGIPKTIEFLRGFIKNEPIDKFNPKKTKLLVTYILLQTANVFNIDKDELLESPMDKAKDARMVCFNILVNYTSMTQRQIGRLFGKTRKHVWYYAQKCDSLLSVNNDPLKIKYDILENFTLEFLEKLT